MVDRKTPGAVAAVVTAGLGTAFIHGAGHDAAVVVERFGTKAGVLATGDAGLIGSQLGLGTARPAAFPYPRPMVPQNGINLERLEVNGGRAAFATPADAVPGLKAAEPVTSGLGEGQPGWLPLSGRCPYTGPLVQPQPMLLPWRTWDGSGTVQTIVETAQPRLIADLEPFRVAMDAESVERVVRRDLVDATTKVADASASAMTFEVFTGKLKMDASVRLAGVAVSFGEVNVYKVSGVVITGVMACKGLAQGPFADCVKAALGRVARSVTETKGEPAGDKG